MELCNRGPAPSTANMYRGAGGYIYSDELPHFRPLPGWKNPAVFQRMKTRPTELLKPRDISDLNENAFVRRVSKNPPSAASSVYTNAYNEELENIYANTLTKSTFRNRFTAKLNTMVKSFGRSQRRSLNSAKTASQICCESPAYQQNCFYTDEDTAPESFPDSYTIDSSFLDRCMTPLHEMDGLGQFMVEAENTVRANGSASQPNSRGMPSGRKSKQSMLSRTLPRFGASQKRTPRVQTAYAFFLPRRYDRIITAKSCVNVSSPATDSVESVPGSISDTHSSELNESDTTEDDNLSEVSGVFDVKYRLLGGDLTDEEEDKRFLCYSSETQVQSFALLGDLKTGRSEIESQSADRRPYLTPSYSITPNDIDNILQNTTYKL
ncbi:hypothetical protein CANCADRAFT_121652 [Tortispora caseinolytica NRRL Y-17796]|uniref:Uncharacterized protein n=1 Tax=Tortispora caseinolytica NRRL Y-17796 TaxID=767744 RepID=A0A1E4THT4_9ASCO|nr:hypothetical protein CANCADRAFT_121652 [Tortispora caseinolytica NRRL Y-17796]